MFATISRSAGFSLAGIIVLTGCGELGPTVEPLLDHEENPADFNENGGLRWGQQDDPSIFDGSLVLDIESLPSQGAAANAPWASSYWPTYQDNINFRWEGAESKSPAEKYGAAFGVADITSQVSRYRGIGAYGTRTECENDSACNADIAEVCAKVPGQTKGRCIPTWWGICHAWAPASILEPEPQQPVTRNGVEFKVNDIKALLTLSYDRTHSKFVSLRCEANDGQEEITYDRYGRPTGNAECQDTNPGTLHVIMANFLGLRQEAFVYDRTFDHQVWNQPVRDFNVLQMDEVTPERANELIGATTEGGENHEAAGTVTSSQWNHIGSWPVTAGTSVHVTMNGTEDADLYVRYGKQPTESGWDCRPYVGGSAETCELEIPAGVDKVFVSVRGYAATSNYSLDVTLGGGTPTNYLFNDKAAKLFHVRTRLRYISESASSTDGNLSADIDRYTHEDLYEYILEVDANGKVFGGEWIGDSKRSHPDFLWLPTGRASETVANGAIRYANVRQLLDASLAGSDNGGGQGEDVRVEKSGSVAKNAWAHYGPFEVSSGELTAVLSGNNDADLYVRRGAQPTSAAWDCRPYVGGSGERCVVNGPGPIYVSVAGYAASSNYGLVVTYKGAPRNGGGGAVTPPAVRHLNETGNVAQGQMVRFHVDVTAGQQIVVRTTGSGDVDLYVAMGNEPSTSNYLKSSTSYTGNEAITYTPSAAGTLHIGVYGYGASSFTLKTSNE